MAVSKAAIQDYIKANLDSETVWGFCSKSNVNYAFREH